MSGTEEEMSWCISTSDGAELAGSAHGHVRQLAREGKIRARMVTLRAWIVHKGDLLEHKRTAEPDRPGKED